MAEERGSADNKPDYPVLLEGGSGEIEEKKSRFIATLRPVADQAEADAFIAEMKKQYWDARHNCSAMVLAGEQELTRCSDDGEPSGTAGRPMLEVLLGSGIKGICCVVTRYFGGTLLGTGGLVRAYTAAVQEGLKHCRIGIRTYGMRLEIRTDYNDIGKILYILGQRGLEAAESEYGADVRLRVDVPERDREALEKAVTEATAGRTVFVPGEKRYYLREELINS
ncbi:MAG: YigZ family protein [Lachnospiraceae bacterium]|nr:YigZ family protein [Lachnospiraceae bacterium]